MDEGQRALNQMLIEDGRGRPPLDAPERAATSPTGAAARKAHPVGTGVLDYFPDAIKAVADFAKKNTLKLWVYKSLTTLTLRFVPSYSKTNVTGTSWLFVI